MKIKKRKGRDKSANERNITKQNVMSDLGFVKYITKRNSIWI